ncbi:hypothetical protein, partial [Ralstonia pseudosolanacearum]|uniref:hypothetical protein n=1 Tax=Ralstonia pseudosolanacearum TaxID=1310165 RepID=UPI001E3C2380
FPAKIENLRRNPVCLQRYRHVVARKRQHGLTTTLIYATTPLPRPDAGMGRRLLQATRPFSEP